MPYGGGCAVGNCANNNLAKKLRGGSLKFHNFPTKDEELTKVWIERCQNYKLINVKRTVVCSDHFAPEDYERDLRNELLNLPLRKKLKPGAVPSIFSDQVPDPDQPAGSKTRREDKFKSKCLLCGTDRSISSVQPSRRAQQQTQMSKLWAGSCAYSVWKLLDVEVLFQNVFANGKYCESCLQITRDIDFAVKAFVKIQEQLEQFRSVVVTLLCQNFEELKTKFGETSFMYGSGKFHGINSYGQIIKSLCDALSVPERDPTAPKIVNVFSKYKQKSSMCSVTTQTDPVPVIHLKSSNKILVPVPKGNNSQSGTAYTVTDSSPYPKLDAALSSPLPIVINRSRKQILVPNSLAQCLKDSSFRIGERVDDEVEFIAEVPSTTFDNTALAPMVSNENGPTPTLPISISILQNVSRTVPRILHRHGNLSKVTKPRKIRKPRKPKILKPISCIHEGCKFRTNEVVELQNHIRGQHLKEPKPFHCECGKQFISKESFTSHRKNHIEPRIPCTDFNCTQMFHFLSSMKSHFRKQHGDGGRKTKCQFCHSKFPIESREELSQHMELHETNKAENCPLGCVFPACPEVSSSVFELREHVREAHDPAPLKVKCVSCDAEFCSKSSLRCHTRSAHGEDSLKCKKPGCSFVAKERNELRNQMCQACKELEKHLCPTCGISLSSRNNLRRHIETNHTKDEDRKYRCSYADCNRKFSVCALYRAHEESHRTDRTLLCHECSKTFKSSRYLLRHLQRHKVVKAKASENVKTGAKVRARVTCKFRKIAIAKKPASTTIRDPKSNEMSGITFKMYSSNT